MIFLKIAFIKVAWVLKKEYYNFRGYKNQTTTKTLFHKKKILKKSFLKYEKRHHNKTRKIKIIKIIIQLTRGVIFSSKFFP